MVLLSAQGMIRRYIAWRNRHAATTHDYARWSQSRNHQEGKGCLMRH